jgi:hypothetical protein
MNFANVATSKDSVDSLKTWEIVNYKYKHPLIMQASKGFWLLIMNEI